MRDHPHIGGAAGALLVAMLAPAAITTIAQPAAAASAEESGAKSIVVTATRADGGVSIDQLGASATILDATALEQRQVRIVSDVLRDAPGVAVSRAGGVGGLTQIRLRGTEANHVLVLVDGIEAADPYSGSFDFGTMVADPAARIEVLRGQQSSLHGSDAIGGVVHYMTLTGAEDPGASMRLEGGSFGTLTGAARIAGVTNDVDYAFSGTLYQTRGYPTARGGRRDVGADLAGLSGKLAWSLSETFRLTGVARYSHGEAESNDSEDDPLSPLFGRAVDSPGVYFRNEAFYGLVRAELIALDGRWTNSVEGQIADFRRSSHRPAGRDGGSEAQRLKTSFVSSLEFGSQRTEHRLTGAVDIERESFRNTTPAAGSSFGPFTGRRQTDNLGFTGQYELLVNDVLSLGASIRRDENDRFADATTWRVQGSYAFAPTTRLRGGWGTGVKNPDYFELFGYYDGRYIGNPDLRPEKSEGWEIGIEHGIGEAATLGLTWFESRLEGEVYTTFPPPEFVARPANRTTRSRQHGLELFLTANPAQHVRLDAAYTWLDAQEAGVDEVRRPRHTASVNATVAAPGERFSGTLTVRYNGAQREVAFTDPTFATTPVVRLGDYWLVNVAAEYRLSPAIALSGRVENLLDDDYEEVFSFKGAGLAAYGGVQARF